MAINKELANLIPTNNNPLKGADEKGTIDNIMQKMEQMVLYDDYMKSIDRNYKTPKIVDEEFNGYKKQLKDLGSSFDDFRGWYYKQHPTKEMQAWDEAGKALNDYVYRILDGTSKDVDTDKREAKKIFVENLAGMINDGQIEYNIDRIKRFVDAYDSIFQNNRNISGPRRGVKTPSSAGQRKFIK